VAGKEASIKAIHAKSGLLDHRLDHVFEERFRTLLPKRHEYQAPPVEGYGDA
jgi:hypothetical protein